jgi:hypothetical protein
MSSRFSDEMEAQSAWRPSIMSSHSIRASKDEAERR